MTVQIPEETRESLIEEYVEEMTEKVEDGFDFLKDRIDLSSIKLEHLDMSMGECCILGQTYQFHNFTDAYHKLGLTLEDCENLGLYVNYMSTRTIKEADSYRILTELWKEKLQTELGI